MPEFFLELFSEEIPARMQAQAAAALSTLITGTLSEILPPGTAGTRYWGARRIAVCTQVQAKLPALQSEQLGPRLNAPDQAVEGFLRKQKATRDQLTRNETHHLLKLASPERPAADVILEKLPEALAKFSWPKSMRWAQGGGFTWVRPLRRIVCLLDGAVVPVTLGPVTAGDETEGHRFMAPGSFAVHGAGPWEAELERRFVIADAEKRRRIILDGFRAQAAEKRLTLVEDDALLDEVSGLVEWPVPLTGCIDEPFMSLPPEVRELSMKVNQRYFALRDQAGRPAPFFAFVANIEAEDGGAAIIAGNERVLRARLADAEHFWTQDRKHPLSDYLPKLAKVTFHAKLGTQLERAERIAALAREIAIKLGAQEHEKGLAERAGRLCKADLVTGMVGEFPELQGIMGGYYADDPAIGEAIRSHYQPKGPNDEAPRGVVPSAVALADKIDAVSGFFAIGEKPTGSGDPYALRRAALGIIRTMSDNQHSIKLKPVLSFALDQVDRTQSALNQRVRDQAADNAQKAGLGSGFTAAGSGRTLVHDPATGEPIDPRVLEILGFIIERLRVLVRSQGERFDVLDSVFAAGEDDDIVSLLDKTKAVGEFLGTEDGGNLLTAYRRAANILRIEDAKDGPHDGAPDPALAAADEERALMRALDDTGEAVKTHLESEAFSAALADLARLRAPVDGFFDAVKINAEDEDSRKNRLRLLTKLRDTMHRIANFSKIEG